MHIRGPAFNSPTMRTMVKLFRREARMRFLKITGLIVSIPLGAFIVFAIALEISERSRPDQSYARSIGQSESSCPDYVVRQAVGAIVANNLPVTLIDSNLRKLAEQKCRERVPW